MASLEENLVVHSDEEDLVSIKKNKKRKKFHECKMALLFYTKRLNNMFKFKRYQF